MRKLYENYFEYQEIEITNKELITKFIEYFYPIWEIDIINFSNLKEEIIPKNVKNICFYSYIGINNELEYIITTQDNKKINYYIEKKALIVWLKQNNLIKREEV